MLQAQIEAERLSQSFKGLSLQRGNTAGPERGRAILLEDPHLFGDQSGQFHLGMRLRTERRPAILPLCLQDVGLLRAIHLRQI